MSGILGLSFKADRQDVQIWDCDPLVIILAGSEIAYSQRTKVEFTPISSDETFGRAVAIQGDPEGFLPTIEISAKIGVRLALKRYFPAVDSMYFGGREGLMLEGTDQFDDPVTWLINEAAVQFILRPVTEPIAFDEQIESILRSEIGSEAKKLELRLG